MKRENKLIVNNWNECHDNGSLSHKMINKLKPETSLKTKIDIAQKKLQLQISKLEYIHEKLQKKNDYIFKKIINAQRINNLIYAKVYALELLEIRKMINMVNNAKLAMEQIQLRLTTMSELGDIVVTLSPCMSIIKGLGSTLNNIIPETNSSMQDLSQTLSEILTESSISQEGAINNERTNEDTKAILEEAQSVIEKKTKDIMPEPPNALSDNNDIKEKDKTMLKTKI